MKSTFSKVILPAFVLLTIFASCSSDDSKGGNPPGNELFLVASSNSILVNESVTFTTSSKDNPVSEVQLFANEVLITNPHTFDTKGTYQVIAKKTGYKDSNVVTIQVKEENEPEPENPLYQHRVIVEDFTGTACGPCARVIKALESLETHTYNGNGYPVSFEDLLIVGVHVNVPSADPFTVSNFAYPLFDFYKTKFQYNEAGYWSPFAVINGEAEWVYPESKNLDQPMKLVKESSAIGIKINSELSANNGSSTVEIAFSEDYDNLSYSVLVVEDNVIHSQAGIGANYSHQSVLRAGTSPSKGTSIPSAESKKGNVFKPEIPQLNYNTSNVNNLRVIVIVRDQSGTIINAQDATANALKDYVVIP